MVISTRSQHCAAAVSCEPRPARGGHLFGLSGKPMGTQTWTHSQRLIVANGFRLGRHHSADIGLRTKSPFVWTIRRLLYVHPHTSLHSSTIPLYIPSRVSLFTFLSFPSSLFLSSFSFPVVPARFTLLRGQGKGGLAGLGWRFREDFSRLQEGGTALDGLEKGQPRAYFEGPGETSAPHFNSVYSLEQIKFLPKSCHRYRHYGCVV